MDTSDSAISDTSLDVDISTENPTTDFSGTEVATGSSSASSNEIDSNVNNDQAIPVSLTNGHLKPSNHIFARSTRGFKSFRRFLSRFKSVQAIFLLSTTVLFKFGLESLTGAVSLIIIKRFEPQSLAITMLGVSTIVYNLSQSLSVLFLDLILKCFRASFLLGLALIVMTVNVTVILLIEIGSGGTFIYPIQRGWPGLPYLLIPIQIILGGCYGLVEVLRKYIAPLIVFEKVDNRNTLTKEELENLENLDYDDEEEEDEELEDKAGKKIERLNSMIHICYEVSGTLGAFFAGFMVRVFGEVFCMIHIPVLFLIAGVCSILILHPSPRKKYQNNRSSFQDEEKDTTVSIKKKIVGGFVEYLVSIWTGMKTVICNRHLNFLFLSLLIPQICHRLKEAIIVPVYSNELMEKDYFVGIFTGASNFGELLGAACVLLFTMSFRKTRNWMVIGFLSLSAFSLNLLWAYPLVPWRNIDEETQPRLFWGSAVALNLIICLASSCYVMSDIMLLSYLQTHVKDKAVLGSVMGFMYIVYVCFLTILILVVGQVIDVLKKKYNPNLAFMVVTGLITFLSLLVLAGGLLLCCAEVSEKKKLEDEEKRIKEIRSVLDASGSDTSDDDAYMVKPISGNIKDLLGEVSDNFESSDGFGSNESDDLNETEDEIIIVEDEI